MTNKEFTDQAARRIGLGVCGCGMDRAPERKVVGAMSVLLCKRCGKGTTERKN